jgi:cystathionine beta-lyase
MRRVGTVPRLIRDLTDDEARVALPLKWGAASPDVLPAWVAEMDYAPAEPLTEALHRAVAEGRFGYPSFGPGGELGEAYAGFAERRFGQEVVADHVLPVVDVTAAVRLAVDVLSQPGPVVLPIPAYQPHHDIGAVTGQGRMDLVLDPDAPRAELDLDRLDHLFRDGARTLVLTQPHNPWGRAFTRPELEGVRDVVVRHGARVVSDEVHGPLVLPGAQHLSYLEVEGTHDHAVALVSASKAFNVPGLRCAQMVVPDRSAMERLILAPPARNDSWSSLGVAAAVACYRDCDAWLDAVLDRLDGQRTMLGTLVAEHLPEARMRPLEATYLAWLDLRAYGHAEPAKVARRKGRVLVSAGQEYQPGLPGHIRLNLATSPERLREIVRRLALALTS